MDGDSNRYYSFHQYVKAQYGEKLYKVLLNGNFTCPNRDGKVGTGGCIFCSAKGSGDFACDGDLSITEQIEQGKKLVKNKKEGQKYIAYFQAFTNTYGPVEYLCKIFTEAISHPDIAVLAIGTRPDCLPEDVLDLLEELNKIKPVWIELGLQTIHEETAKFIRRGYPLSVFQQAVVQLQKRNIDVVVHLILGLPNETNQMILESIAYLNQLPIQGVKLSLLHILKDTDLAGYYEEHPFPVYSMEEYVDLVVDCIAHLREDIVIHRLTGDGPRKLLVAPLWSCQKRVVMNTIHKKLKDDNITQGCRMK
jgi:radical SAM protein (TIGR01212 family)